MKTYKYPLYHNKGHHVLKVNPIYTSQCCNNCGSLQKMSLSERTYRCRCGYIEDMDVNAAKNIKLLGQSCIVQPRNTFDIANLFTGRNKRFRRCLLAL